MKITFKVGYNTAWGENLFISGNIPELGNGREEDAVAMAYADGIWSVEVDVPAKTKEFSYSYLVKNNDASTKNEWGKPHLFRAGKGLRAVEVLDNWLETPIDKSYYSSMFVDAVFRRQSAGEVVAVEGKSVTLLVTAPSVRPDEELLVTGSWDTLGAWDTNKALVLSDADYPLWAVTFPADDKGERLDFKFFKRNKNTGIETWEYCNNREYSITAPKNKTVALVISGLRFCDSAYPWKGAGTAIPVFSIRTEDDYGVGDFLSIKKMVDWLSATNQTVLQILPINDTTMTRTWTDSYPYNSNSTFALHPMYLNLRAMGELLDEGRRFFFEEEGRRLNALAEVDYEAVNNLKCQYINEIYAQNGDQVLESDEFKSFVEKNNYWLRNYSAFCYLRDINGTADFSQWDDNAVYSAEKVDALYKDHEKEILKNSFVQFYLDRQLKESCRYAHERGVVLKGDIPIGISRTSVDAWTDPDLFNMDSQAGAPPDDFSVMGQNWGFPTYNWERMSQDGFQWWKNRMRKMSEYFDLYRIDHILGFFRIWQIPMTAVHGLLGTFNPAMPFSPDEMRNNYDFWIDADRQCRPYIMDYFLGDFFGEYTEEAKERFLYPLGDGRYGLKEEVDNQRKVANLFASWEKNEKNQRLENALYGLLDEVLFIEDANEKGKYHPRISAQFTYIYRSLNDYERWCFNRLYNDFFYHRHNDFWYWKAMMKLPALVNSTDMLVCGEDLGMIPDCVPAVMSQLQILSLEIQRMPKDPKVEFGNPYHYPYLAVCTTSTHDMGGIRSWWEENHEKTQHFFNSMLGKDGGAPFFAEPWICDIIVSQHLESPSMLVVLPWQDWMSIDGQLRRENPKEEQINVPAISRYYWRYRMHLSLEQLMQENVLNNNIKEKIKRTGRI